jgi:arginyl-tRNA--protein-N-Asp/Glu arginylyltransferase
MLLEGLFILHRECEPKPPLIVLSRTAFREDTPTMEIHQISNGHCPYLPSGEWITNVFSALHITGHSYEHLLENGWRRSGCCFYHNVCPDCTSCIPLRVDVNRFCLNRSQKRTLKRNCDITIERIPAVFDERDYALYKHYCLSRHNQSPTEDEYTHFLVQSPLTTEIMRYWIDADLIAIAWIDILPKSVSSVYCAYDPAHAQRSPGTLSILSQIELCRKLHKPWLYLGFYVPASPRMRYKKNFHPCQELINQQWRDT